MIETRAKASSGLGNRMLSVIIVIEHGMSRGIFLWKKESKDKKSKQKEKDYDD